jgi:hypothetical protein
MSKPRRLRSCVDFNSPPSRLPQERLAQAALRTTQSIPVVDVKNKTAQDAPGAIFSRGVAASLSPFFRRRVSSTQILARQAVRKCPTQVA